MSPAVVMLGAAADPFAAFSGPVMPVWPSAATELVISAFISAKTSLTAVAEAFVPGVKVALGFMVPEPFLGIHGVLMLRFCLFAAKIGLTIAMVYVVAVLPVKAGTYLLGIPGAAIAFVMVFIAAVAVNDWLDKHR